MTETLNGLMVDSISGDSFNMESDASSEETNAILQEASAVAEHQIGEKFPTVPSLELPAQQEYKQTPSTSTFE